MNLWMISTYIWAGGFGILFIIMSVVVTIGGIYDLKYLFKTLKEQAVDETDDGRVEE